MNKQASCRQRGFTIIELMVTIAIAAILISIAVPSFQDSIRRNRVAAATGNLVSAISAARAEAIRRATVVTICPSTNGTACTVGGAWNTGWIMYHTAVFNVANIVQVGGALQDVSIANTDNLVFSARGMLNPATAVSLVVRPSKCDVSTIKKKTVAVGVAGRTSVVESACP